MTLAQQDFKEAREAIKKFVRDTNSQASETIPIGSRVLLRLPTQEKKDVKGLVNLEKDLAHVNEGTVVAMGAGQRGKNGKRIPFDFKIGDHVIVAKFAGTQVKMDRVDHLMVFSEDVVGVKE